MKPYDVGVYEFKGLSKLPVVGDSELKSCTNMVFDNYPVMTVRKGRETVISNITNAQAIISTGDKLAYVANQQLVYDGNAISGLTLSDGSKSMVAFWGKIFIFPDKKYYDIASGTYGDIGTGTYPANGSVS